MISLALSLAGVVWDEQFLLFQKKILLKSHLMVQ